MAVAVIGRTYTFTALFVNSIGQVFSPTSPTIEIFYYSPTGDKLVLEDEPMVATSEIGRFIFVYGIPSSLIPGKQLYAIMRGQDNLSGAELRSEEELELLSAHKYGAV